ncbi:MAG: inositol monophosphatase family protein [Thermodesulfobacteriota bacterium]
MRTTSGTSRISCRSARARKAQQLGALDLCYLACGRFDGFWELGLNPWDTAAGVLIVEEAGASLLNLTASLIVYARRRRYSHALPAYKKGYDGVLALMTLIFICPWEIQGRIADSSVSPFRGWGINALFSV